MNNRLIFVAMLFIVLHGIAGEIDKYPQYKQFIETKSESIIPLSLILEGRYYVRLEKKEMFVDDNIETGKIGIKDGSLHAEVIRKYPSSGTRGIYTGTFRYFEPGKPLVCDEKVINTFVDGYRQLDSASDDDKKVIYMELVERLEGRGDGYKLKKAPEIRTFVIDKNQVDAIVTALEAEKTSESSVAFFKKLLCGAGLLALVVVCYSKFFAK